MDEPSRAAQPERAATEAPAVPSLTERRLLSEALPLLRAEARKLWARLGCRLELGELEALGHETLVRLVREHDPARGPFGPFASPRLRWAILDAVRRETHGRVAAARAAGLRGCERLAHDATAPLPADGPARPADPEQARGAFRAALSARAAALSVALVASAGDLAGVAAQDRDPEQCAIHARDARRIRDAVAELPEPQRALVTRHYFDDERFEQIADELGISKSWASRLHAQAMATLATQLGAVGTPVTR